MTRRSSRSSRRSWAMVGLSRHEYREGAALTLEDRLPDITQILAVDLEWERLATADLESVDVVPVKHSCRLPAEDSGDCQPRNRPRPHMQRRDEIEPALEMGFRRKAQRQASEVGVGVAVGDQRERRRLAVDLEHGLEPSAARPQRARNRERKRAIRRPAATLAAELVDSAHDLRGEPHRTGEREAAVVDPAD